MHEFANAHDSYIYALALCRHRDRLYSSSSDGTIRYIDRPLHNANNDDAIRTGTILMHTPHDEITALFCPDNDADGMMMATSSGDAAADVDAAEYGGPFAGAAPAIDLWSGDDKGVIICWRNDRIAFKYNLIEEVRSLWVENRLLYTARDLDAVVTDLGVSRSGMQYVTIGTIAGRAPLALIGRRLAAEPPRWPWPRRAYLVFVTRDGRGVQMVKNERRFETVWVRSDAHEMIINALCSGSATPSSRANDAEADDDEASSSSSLTGTGVAGADVLYTAGYDGRVKKWIELGGNEAPLLAGDVRIGCCVNALCAGPAGVVYVADTRGVISRVGFTGLAA